MDWLQSLDVAAFRFINLTLSNPLLDGMLPFFSWNALFVPGLAVLTIGLFWKGGPRGRLFLVFLSIVTLIGDPLIINSLKKAIGREECALCEIVYSPVGKRRAWGECAARLGVTVREMHRDELPEAWGIQGADLPCVLGRERDAHPFVLVTRDEILACQQNPEALERAILDGLQKAHAS
mgnify:CR=1 FL=1